MQTIYDLNRIAVALEKLVILLSMSITPKKEQKKAKDLLKLNIKQHNEVVEKSNE